MDTESVTFDKLMFTEDSEKYDEKWARILQRKKERSKVYWAQKK